jgi:hypothetical protein
MEKFVAVLMCLLTVIFGDMSLKAEIQGAETFQAVVHHFNQIREHRNEVLGVFDVDLYTS